jgi:hypothetical protein
MAVNSTLTVAEKQANQLSIASTPITTPTTLEHIINIAKVMAASGFYPDAKSAQQAAALMIMGQQFGLTPAQALTGIHIVKGKPMLHYSVILAKVRQHPDYDYRITEHTDKICAIEFTRHGEPCGNSTFTEQDAKRAGTQNMDKHGKTMLLARAASNGVKWYCPDVLNGMPVYVDGEINAEYTDAPVAIKDQLKAEFAAQLGESTAPALEAPEAPPADEDGVIDGLLADSETAEPSEPEPDYTVDEDGLKRSKTTGRLID